MDELWRELSEESESNALSIKVADTVSDIVVKIIETRVEKGLTQAQVAEMAGLDRKTVGNLERIDAFPNIDTIVRVASVLGIEIGVKE